MKVKRTGHLERLRVQRGMSQHALADAAGITQGYVSMLENGKRSLRDLTKPYAFALAKALGATVEELVR
jgi:transcriptional regulator with XRE-family HTH domain